MVDFSSHRLTEGNLLSHNDLLQQGNDAGSTTWAERVIKQEQIHLYYSQDQRHGFEWSQVKGQGQAQGDIHRTDRAFPTEQQPMTDLKMFEQTQGMCLETPLERFLTPDACSDTSYFARLALTQMGTSFSCMEGREQRSKKAKENVLAARRNGKPRGESQTAQGKSCRMDKRIGRLS